MTINPKLVEQILSQFERKDRVSVLDVVGLPENEEEIETWGLFCACLSWGGIQNKVGYYKKFYQDIPEDFLEFIENPREEVLRKIYPNTPSILRELCETIHTTRREKGRISDLVSEKGSVESAIFHLAYTLRNHLEEVSEGKMFNLPKAPKNIPEDPSKFNKALKRYVMYFRWMVRDEEPDFGIWDFFDKKDLLHPIDTHVARILSRWNVLPNTQTDWRNVKKATQFFREVEPEDPIKYDYHLVTFGQKYCEKNSPNCGKCPVKNDFDCMVQE